jgi:hypothetical protein
MKRFWFYAHSSKSFIFSPFAISYLSLVLMLIFTNEIIIVNVYKFDRWKRGDSSQYVTFLD